MKKYSLMSFAFVCGFSGSSAAFYAQAVKRRILDGSPLGIMKGMQAFSPPSSRHIPGLHRHTERKALGGRIHGSPPPFLVIS